MTTSRHKSWDPYVIPATAPVGVFLGFTADDSAAFCRATQFITDGPWGHVFVGFWFPDGTGCYFEALISDGVTGPWPIERVQEWSKEDLKHRLAIVDLPRSWIPGGDLSQALACARSAVGKHSYWKVQLLAMLMFERYGRAMIRSETKTVCSEYAAWVLQGIIDLRDRRRTELDAVNPNSAWRRVCEELSGLGANTRPIAPETELPEGILLTDGTEAAPGIGAGL